jgi:hypothetical protein
MVPRNRITTILAAGAMTLGGLTVVTVVDAHAAPAVSNYYFENCTNLHKKWPHGVGRRHAHDHTTGTPVTTFKRSNRLYRKAMNYKSGLDADKDKIACESA